VSILPTLPVKIGFDIESSDEWSDVWRNPTARTLMLLWRPCHLITGDYQGETLRIAEAIDREQPKTVEALANCFPRDMSGTGCNYIRHDVDEFVKEALPFFTGEREATFEITTQ